MKNVLLLLVILIVLTAASVLLSDRWIGFYYPDGCLTCTEDYMFSPEFSSKDDCLDWAKNIQDERNNPSDEFECGKNCKAPDTIDGLYICEETLDF